MRAPAWLRKRWVRRTLWAVGVVLVVYAAYMVFARVSDGHGTDVFIEAGTNEDGSMYYHCIGANSSAGVCDSAQPSHVTVGHRDRVHWTIYNKDLGVHTHDFKVKGFAYGFPYPWVEMELKKPTESKTFTAWKSGEFRFICELPGHEDLGMWGTLTVR